MDYRSGPRIAVFTKLADEGACADVCDLDAIATKLGSNEPVTMKWHAHNTCRLSTDRLSTVCIAFVPTLPPVL
jgi:hypothetical protein